MHKPMAVCNASPLIIFSKIGKVDLLIGAFQAPVIIEETVYREVIVAGLEKKKPNAQLVQKYIDDRRVVVKKAKEVREIPIIDKGERATISLALEKKADFVCIDEADGRAAARRLGLKPVGCLGVIHALLRQRKIGKKKALEIIQEMLKVNLRINAKILEEFKNNILSNKDFLP